jgi:anti-anti-sigma factor
VATVGHTLDSGVIVFDIPASMALGYVANSEQSTEDRLSSAEKLVAELTAHLENGARRFVIDLSCLNHIDSAGLGIVLGCRNLIAKAGGKVRAVTPHDGVRGVFDLTHLRTVLPLDRSLDAALAALDQ